MNSRRPDEPNDALHLLLGRLIHAYARLDHFIGLQLAWLGDYRGLVVAPLLKNKIGFAPRFQALQKLALETWCHSDPKVADEFNAWFEAVKHAQAQRNKLAHGRWGYMHSDSKEIEFVQLSWQIGSGGPKPAVKVVLSDFSRLVDDVERLSQDFMRLQKKFELRVRYTKEWEDANPVALKNWCAHQATLAV